MFFFTFLAWGVGEQKERGMGLHARAYGNWVAVWEGLRNALISVEVAVCLSQWQDSALK